ncbi:MAG: response regulator transcription factor [Chloroflexota bacterium]
MLEAIEFVKSAVPDLILMDLKMPGVNGIEATRRIRTKHPDLKILVLTTYDDDQWIFDAIRAGAAGYLLKDTPHTELIDAVKGTVSGKAYTDPRVTEKLLKAVASQHSLPPSLITDKLTPREIDVLREVARGHNNAAIAERLSLSEGTVRNHVSAILAKLEITDRTQAAVLAIRHGIN